MEKIGNYNLELRMLNLMVKKSLPLRNCIKIRNKELNFFVSSTSLIFYITFQSQNVFEEDLHL